MSKSKILSNYKNEMINELKDNISTGASNYYVFAANPVEIAGDVPDVVTDDYSTQFINNWSMLFGKKLKNTDISAVIKKNNWISKVYDFYDNRNPDVLARNNFYAISPIVTVGGYYHIYKCLDNNNNGVSTVDPGSIVNPTQLAPFTLSDKYKWVYIASVSQAEDSKFGTADYFPVTSSPAAVAAAADNSGVEKVVIVNGGSGYRTYANGTVKSIARLGNVVQLDDTAVRDDNYYQNSSIYFSNEGGIDSQIKTITQHYSNSVGNWCRLDSTLNVAGIIPNVTKYYISPKVVFDTDGKRDPIAYSVVEPVANSISKIIILDAGSDISWANVSIQSNTVYGTGANLYAIVPPPGGHASNPASELNTLGMSISFNFSDTESNTIYAANVVYNKIGIIKNPYALNANSSKSTALLTANAFNQVMVANVYPNYVFAKDTLIKGATSGALARVLFSNTSQIYLVGDKSFINGEVIRTPEGNSVNIEIKTRPSVYTKDINPLYVQNINNVNRANGQVESFKLIIQV